MTGRPSSAVTRRLSRWGRWAIVGWCAGLLGLPPLLSAAGLRPALVEQRVPAEAPGFSIGRVLDTDWYEEIAVWFTDRLALRDRAIEADALLDLRVFGQSPSPRVLVGTDGWLYLRDDFAVPCYPADAIQAAVDELALLDRALQLAGKRFLFVVAPDKSAIYPDHLGGLAADAECALANRGTFRALAAAAGMDGYIDTWSSLEEAAAGPRPVYHRLDTHWNDFGAGVAAETIVEHLRPGLWDESQFVLVGSEIRIGDLGRLMGLSLSAEVENWQVQRGEEPAVQTERVARGIEAVTSTVEDDAVIGLSGLMIHDSMGNALAPLLRPYFGQLTTVRAVATRGSFGTDQAWFAGALAEADLLMVIKVERLLLARLQGGLAADVVGALAGRLPHSDIPLTRELADAQLGTRWARTTGEVVTTGVSEARIPLSLPATRPGADRYLVVDLRPKGRIQVRLRWLDPNDGSTGELVDVILPGATTASFDLSSVGSATEVELVLGTTRGRRVTGITVVEIPPRAGDA